VWISDGGGGIGVSRQSTSLSASFRRMFWRMALPGPIALAALIAFNACTIFTGYTLPLWFMLPVFVAVLIALVYSATRIRRLIHRHTNRLCLRCGYDQRGNADPGVCPECGFRMAEEAGP